MDSIEKKLNNTDYSIYKKVKSFIINKYPNYHRNLRFNSAKGLVSYVDGAINRYATVIENEDFNVVPNEFDRRLNTISSIASSQKDAEIMGNVLLDFISNSEAVLVNGSMKFIVYSIIYMSEYSSETSGIKVGISSLLNNFIPGTSTGLQGEAYSSLLVAAEESAEELRKDKLFSILSSCFAYTRKLLVYFSRYFAQDRRLNSISYKQSINTVQTLINSLLEIFISVYFTTVTKVLNDFSEIYSPFYFSSFNSNIYNQILNFLPNIYNNNIYSLQDSPKKILQSFLLELATATQNTVPNTLNFNDVVDELDEEYFLGSKETLKNRFFSFLNRI